MNMIKGEWNYIRHNRLILISVLAIMFIPFLYCIFFLKSVWDPYGETGKLPVAVVNQDQAVTYQGQKLNVGDQTVTNLKKNHQLGWRFVSAKTAADGLKHHKYYTVITIPKNFSANAATALDTHPKKMTFTYKTNGSANYIAQVMSEVGSDKLNSEIRAKVTKAYAQATFKQIYAVGKGMNKAAKGSAQLKDGTVTLTDGLNTYTTGVHKLNNGLQQMKTQVQPLATGIQKLATGSASLQSGLVKYTAGVDQYATGVDAYTSGVGQYVNGVNAYTNGVSQLSAGMPKLTAGTSELASGANSLKDGTYKYVDGVYTLNSGVKSLGSGATALASGVTQLANGSSTLNSGLATLSGNSGTLNSGASGVANGASQVSAGVQELQSQLNSLMGGNTVSDLQQAQALISNLQAIQNNAQLTALSTSLSPALKNLIAAEAQLNQAMSTEKSVASKLTSDASSGTTTSSTTTNGTAKSAVADAKNATAAAQATADKIAAAAGDSSKVATLTKTLKSELAEVQSQTGNINTANSETTSTSPNANVKADASSLVEAQKTVAAATAAFQTAMTNVMTAMNQTGLDATTVSELSQLTSASSSINLNDLSKKLTSLGAMASDTTQLQRLIQGANDLSKGATQLSTGVNDYTSGVDKAFEGSKVLNTGLSKLNSQVPTLTNGVTQIVNGTAKLAKNGSSLKSGSKSLATGVSTLNSGIQAAASGVSQLNANTPKLTAAGAKLNANTPKLTAAGNKLMSSSNQLNQGAAQLSSGLTTLNSKVPTLTSGVNQLANGSQQLDDSSAKLMAGANKLQKGNGKLAKSLKSGADEINAQPLTSKTADMFAAPTHLKHESYSYVPNYGHALAPYVLSVALYVGALVFNFAFPIRKVSMAGGSATGWYLSKVSIGAFEALAMGLIEPALMMLGGLSVDHPGSMFLVSVMFAEASMFIVMFLSMLLDNPGRFIAMVLLMLQLGGSGGTFPMEVTNHFYNVVHPFLPMTYSILGFRQAITSGMSGMVGQAFWMLLLFTVIGLALLWPTMIWLQKKHLMGLSQLDDNQKLQAVEDPESNSHS